MSLRSKSAKIAFATGLMLLGSTAEMSATIPAAMQQTCLCPTDGSYIANNCAVCTMYVHYSHYYAGICDPMPICTPNAQSKCSASAVYDWVGGCSGSSFMDAVCRCGGHADVSDPCPGGGQADLHLQCSSSCVGLSGGG